MPNQNTGSVATRVMDELCRENPTMPARTLARMAYTKYPELWPSLEAARTAARARFGVLGKKDRVAIAKREPRKPGNQWRDFMPAPKRTVDMPWGPVQISGPCRALILSDIHVPFYDQRALELAIDYGIKRSADVVVLNGDIVDHYGLSRWQKDPRLRDFPGEIHDGRTLLHGIRLAFPDARIFWKLGNHEERFEDYMMSHAPDFLGVAAFEWENVFGLKHENVHLVADKRPIVLGGKLHIMHGHEWRIGSGDLVNPARTYFIRSVGVHVIGGDKHRTSQHSENNLEQNVVSSWSTGCLCELHPKYMPINKWNHGFAFVETDERGAFQVENKRIVDGQVWA